MNGPVDWVSAVSILLAGLILGAMFIYFVKRRSNAAPPEDLELFDLEAKRDVLLQQLRELDFDSKLTPEQAVAERTRLELETAQVLRSIDEHKKKPALKGGKSAPAAESVAAAATPAPSNRAALVGFAWGVGSVLVLVGLGWFVMNQSKDRQPGEGMSGGMAPTGTMQAQRPPTDPAVLQAEAAVKAQPDNLDARVELARQYLEHDNLMGVFDQTQLVLQKSPDDARAMTYQAIVRMAMGQAPLALEMLQKATKKDPQFIDGWVALGWVNAQQGKMKEAQAAIDEAIKQHPEEKARLTDVFAQMKQQATTQPQAPAQASMPAGHPAIPPPGGETMSPAAAAMPDNSPMISGAPAAAPAAADGSAIHVTLDVDPAAKSKLGTGGVLYVIARPAGVAGGPPTLVKRLPAGQFPLTFDLGAADSMMGQPVPPKSRLEVRLDHDGDAATRSPNDLDVVADGVASGATVKLTLK